MNISQELDEKGYTIIKPFSDLETIRTVLTELQVAFKGDSVVTVAHDGIFMNTLNGEDLLSKAPHVKALYDHTLAFATKHFGTIVELSEKKIGISSNLLRSVGDSFRYHFDRNQLTVVIYLHDLGCLPLSVYPNIRHDPSVTGKEETFDLSARTPVNIYPEENKAILFLGRRAFHGVINEGNQGMGNVERYSLQFAFDFHTFSYADQEYYGQPTN